MCTVMLHVLSDIAELTIGDSKLTILIYTGVRHSELSLSGVRINVFKVVIYCNGDITAQLRHITSLFYKVKICIMKSIRSYIPNY